MSKRLFTDSRVVPAPPEEVFALLADPSRHAEFDGSGTVQGLVSDPGPMQSGSKFKMDMKMGRFSYKVTNTVVEFEENRRIAWCHMMRNRWRYELEPVEGGTQVTESADFSLTRFRPPIMFFNGDERTEKGIAATLDNLVARFSSEVE